MSARGMYINTVPADKVVSEALQVKLNTPVFRVQRIFYSGRLAEKIQPACRLESKD
jgi:DNA-binding GntR family transcriptional regulator